MELCFVNGTANILARVIGRLMGKFGINAKAVEGRERKKAAAEAKKKQKQAVVEAKEAEEWKQGAKSTEKREQEEAKRLEKLAKKKEREALEAEESSQIKVLPNAKAAKAKTEKVTQHDLLIGKMFSEPSKLSRKGSNVSAVDHPLEPLNRPASTVYSSQGGSVNGSRDDLTTEYSASNLEDAISLLDLTSASHDKTVLERHPERRVKAAFTVFEEREMPILKLENPGLRHSQLRELLKKKWAKAPENPFNQATISYRASKEEEVEASRQFTESRLSQFRS